MKEYVRFKSTENRRKVEFENISDESIGKTDIKQEGYDTVNIMGINN